MFKQYRGFEAGEFVVVGGDCSQGGKDYNSCAFLSKSKIDVPLVYHTHGVAAQMTSDIHPILERIFDTTGVRPVVAFETNNGGISEMERLANLNRLNKYKVFKTRSIGQVDSVESGKYGYSTNSATRPILLGDWKNAIDKRLVRLYDKETINEHFSFIINRAGRPEAESTAHDDLIFAHAIAWQLYQTESKPQHKSNADFPDDTKIFSKGYY